ncbi:MAG: exodeoxyribonuclease VII small subunit [Ardenticatenaceae bacterium]
MEGLSFEEAYSELETVVARLEEGATTLEEALQLYERGTTLAQHCTTLLNSAELRVSQLRDREDGELDEAPFEFDQ